MARVSDACRRRLGSESNELEGVAVDLFGSPASDGKMHLSECAGSQLQHGKPHFGACNPVWQCHQRLPSASALLHRPPDQPAVRNPAYMVGGLRQTISAGVTARGLEPRLS